jgi:hypothetical protein
MKKTLIIIIYLLIYRSSMAQTSPDITDIYNNTISLQSLQGKKILIVILPLQKDTAAIDQLLRFQKKYEKKVAVLGLVTVQPGSPSVDFYKNTYNDASKEGLTITTGISKDNKATDERASTIQWLTAKSNNRQADRYAPGSKYFLSEDGRLYAQLEKGIHLDAPIVQSIINVIVPKAIARTKEDIKSTPGQKF